MHVYVSTLHMPFALRAIINTFRYFLHVFFLKWRFGQFLQLVMLSFLMILSGEFSEGTKWNDRT